MLAASWNLHRCVCRSKIQYRPVHTDATGSTRPAGDFEQIVSAGGFRADSRSFQLLTLGCVTPPIRLRGCVHSDGLSNKTSKQVLEHMKQQTQVCYHESLESQTRIGVSQFWHKAKAVRRSVSPTRDSRALASSRCTDSRTLRTQHGGHSQLHIDPRSQYYLTSL